MPNRALERGAAGTKSTMAEFERTVRCERCRRGWRVVGASANPSNETQGELSFPCACGATVSVMLPGSTNRDLVRIEPEGSPPATDPRR